MATTIITKNGSGAPLAGDLSVGELAVDLTNKQLYTKNGSGVIPLGGQGGAGQWEQNGDDIYYNDGNVGIGTVSPDAAIEVYGEAGTNLQTNRTAIFRHPNINQGAIEIRNGRGDSSVVNRHSSIQAWSNEFTNPVDLLLNPEGGNVGIGTGATVGGQLHVKESASSNTASASAQNLVLESNETSFGMTLLAGSSTTNANIFFGNESDNDIGYIQYKHSDDSVRFGVNAAERMRINSSGNVGIGETNPQAGLHLSGAKNTIRLDTGSGEYWNIQGGTNLAIEDNGTERMRINSSGNVGIGTTSPSNPLTVIATNTNLLVEGEGISATGIAFETNNTTRASIGCATASADLSFFSDAGSTETMRIDSSGNVGIGTTSPTGFAGYTSLDINNATSGALIDLSHGDAMKGRLIATQSTMAIESASSVPIIFQPEGTEAMRIDTSGNILVGCTSFGSVSTEGCQLGNNGTALFSNDSDIPLYLNRTTSGVTTSEVVVSFFRNDVQSGTIGVSQGGTPAFGAPSDIRLKENVADHKSELTNVMALRPVSWDWKDNSKGAGEGFVAQELEQTAWADLVSEGEDGYKMVSGLGAVETRLIKALQEAVTRIETLEAEVAALKGA